MQEYAVFISSEGEVLVYQGNDPNFASTWGLVSRFRMGRPIGRRCYETYGADVILLGADGAVPLSQAMVTSRAQPEIAISNKITNLISSDIFTYASNFGWQIKLFPIGQKLIINVPQVESGTQYQYVMNTITRAWCVFTGWNGACFEILGDKLFYGGNGVVVQADTGNADNGAYITAVGKPAFSYFKSHTQKMFTMVILMGQLALLLGFALILMILILYLPLHIQAQLVLNGIYHLGIQLHGEGLTIP